MSEILLAIKTHIPPLRGQLVNRAHLIQRMNEGIHQNNYLTLISAPAGFGKSTLVNEWIRQTGIPTAWLSLDKGDNDPTRFITHLAAAIQQVEPDVGKHTLAMMQLAKPPPVETALSALINDLTEYPHPALQSPNLILVLEDYHEIVADAVHSILLFLIDHFPTQLHLAVTTRADPPWPIARLRARHEITELRSADLRFTPEETSSFLNEIMHLSLSPENISLLDARTEGWIAGLQMAAVSMQGRDDTTGFIQNFSGSHRFILDYLLEEVLDRQPVAIQEFLLKTSILDRLTASLCNAITGVEDSQSILARLEQANLFLIPLDDERQWYRYHHLFADLLRNHLERLHPGQVSALQGRASAWYRERGMATPAISYALHAHDIEQAERLVMEDVLAVSFYGELYTLIEALERLPADVLRSHPWLYIAYTWALKFAGRDEDCKSSLRNIEAVLSEEYAAGGTEAAGRQERHMRGHLAALRSLLPLPEAKTWEREADLARTALELLPEDDLRMRAFVTGSLAALLQANGDLEGAMQAMQDAIGISRTVGDLPGTIYQLSQLAGMQLYQGKLEQTLAACQDAIRLAEAQTRQSGYFSYAAKDAYLFACRALYERNRLGDAEQSIRKGIDLSEKSRTVEEAGFDYLLLARVLQARGDTDGVLQELSKVHKINQHTAKWMADYVAAWEALLSLQQGNLGAAIRWAEQSGLGCDDEVTLRTYVKHIVLARVLTAQGRLEFLATGSGQRLQEAARLLDRLVALAESAGGVRYKIETRALQAVLLAVRGDLEEALHALERALTLAEPEGFVRTFIDEGAPLAHLLRQAALRGIAPAYTARLLAALDEHEQLTHHQAGAGQQAAWLPSAVPSGLLVEPLTERELEVLSLLRTSLSLPEIAGQLIVSENTVRSHVKHIYAKFNVHTRTAAIVQGEKLGLL